MLSGVKVLKKCYLKLVNVSLFATIYRARVHAVCNPRRDETDISYVPTLPQKYPPQYTLVESCIITVRPDQNDGHFTDGNFNRSQIARNNIPHGSNESKTTLVQVMAYGGTRQQCVIKCLHHMRLSLREYRPASNKAESGFLPEWSVQWLWRDIYAAWMALYISIVESAC